MSHQVVDDVEAIVLAVVGVDAPVGLLPHVVFQCRLVPEGFFAVQTLQTERQRNPKVIRVNQSVNLKTILNMFISFKKLKKNKNHFKIEW